MYCQKCGKELPDGAKFCAGCGCKTDNATKKKPGVIRFVLQSVKRAVIFLGTFLVYHIIFSNFFPVDETNTLVAPDWYVWLGIAVASAVAFWDKIKTIVSLRDRKTQKQQPEAPAVKKDVKMNKLDTRIWVFVGIAAIVAAFFVFPSNLRPLVLVLIFVGWKIYEICYFKGSRFLETKDRIYAYIKDCNDLNAHIESLKDTALVINRTEYGISEYKDTSSWNVKRPELKKIRNAPNVYHCSRTVCDNARRDPFKYICKYFGIAPSEENLVKFETILNNFEAAEEGKIALRGERESILASIETEVPMPIRKLSRRKLERELGFDAVDFNAVYFPKYTFRYTSSGGNTSTQCDITMDISNLNDFVHYLSEKIKFSKSVAGQRALMTSKLRQTIKERDNFTCKHCGISISEEPHLLLEIDHIVPVSRGGLTTPENLQTLCWKCNRSKGAKV